MNSTLTPVQGCLIDFFSLFVCLILSRNSLTSFVAISFTFSLSIPYFFDSCSILLSVNVPVKNMAEGFINGGYVGDWFYVY